VTFRQFNYLDQDSKELVCWQEGVLLAERKVRGFTYHLYQVSGFYIEIQYTTSFNTTCSFNAFETTDKLDPYLRAISLKWLHEH
jgi:hypothetical protein